MLRRSTFSFSGLVALLALLLPSLAVAQVHVPSPAQTAPAGQRLQFQPERPDVGGEPLITMPDEGNRKLHGGAKFVLKGIHFENATAFSEKQLKSEYEEFIGKDANLDTLQEIAHRITVRYRNAGYILSRAVVPPQEIKDGVATIRIVEAYVDKVMFEGIDPNHRLLVDYANKIRNAHPLDAATLERYLLLIEDLPGVTARAVIKPSATSPGASDVVVTVAEKHIDGSVEVDNRGTRWMGPLEGTATANVNDALGLFDRTTLRMTSAAEFDQLHYEQVIHEEQLDSEGTKLALSAGWTHTHPGYTLDSIDLEGGDQLYSALLSHPFIRSRQSNLFGNIQFDIHDTDDSIPAQDLYDDHLRVARIGGSYDFIDQFLGVNRMTTTVSQGLNWGAGSNPGDVSRVGGQTDFTKFNGEITRLQPIYGPFSLYVAGTGQASSNTLLLAEQFSLGGASYGSAYDPAELLGDSGIAGRAEMRYTRSGDFAWVPDYELYGFYDIGTVWNRDAQVGTPDQASLADTGIGMRFNASAPLSGGAELGFPLTRPVAADVGAGGQGDGYHPRFFFSLAYRF